MFSSIHITTELILQIALLGITCFYGIRIAIVDFRTFRIPNALLRDMAIACSTAICLKTLIDHVSSDDKSRSIVFSVIWSAFSWLCIAIFISLVSRGSFGMGDAKYIGVLSLMTPIYQVGTADIIWFASWLAIVIFLYQIAQRFRIPMTVLSSEIDQPGRCVTLGRHFRMQASSHIAFGPYLSFSAITCFAFALVG